MRPAAVVLTTLILDAKSICTMQMDFEDDMPSAADGLTVGEASVITGLRRDQINDAIDRKRVPSRWVTAENGRRRLDKTGLVAFVIETSLAGRVPAEVRQRWYAKLAEGASPGRLVTEDPETSVTYQVDLRPYRADIDNRWKRLKSAKRLIVEDPDIQAGAATFRGTRILVHPIADALAAGIAEAELLEDYPRLTRDLLDAARIWCMAYPRRGRPRTKTPWQEASARAKQER